MRKKMEKTNFLIILYGNLIMANLTHGFVALAYLTIAIISLVMVISLTFKEV